jgi:predicted CXXCH cytochrome family protein
VEKVLNKGKTQHKPVVTGQCSKCHSPHAAKLNKLLLAMSPDLCLTCHKNVQNKVKTEKAHPPALADCQRCHMPHTSAEPSLLTEPIHDLCGACHNLKDDEFKKAHINIDASVIDCRTCHDPHASKDPKFFKDNIHPPFAGRTCEDCHVVKQ